VISKVLVEKACNKSALIRRPPNYTSAEGIYPYKSSPKLLNLLGITPLLVVI